MALERLPLTPLVLWGGKARPGEGWPCTPYPSALMATATKWKLKEIALFWQKNNYVETSTAVLSGVNRCFLGFETATLCLLYLL